MQLTSNESTFLNMIKKTCVDEGLKNDITPSVVGVLGIVISNWGTSKEFFNTRNIYLLLADNNWFGKCYSSSSGKVYDKVADCKESGTILYRVYTDHRNSIKDFISELISSRRSENGPLRYSAVIGKSDYKETINALVRNGFMKNFLNRNDDIDYISTLISIIEKYELFKWDGGNVSRRKKYHTSQVSNDAEEVETVVNENTEEDNSYNEHIYRVRLDWDKRDTQIFSSPSYEDAKEEALKHEGYKIYIDDEGELFEDPWEELRLQKAAEVEDDSPKPILHVLGGEPVFLDNTPVYKSSIDKSIMKYLSGKFYFYDSTISNNRAKITVHSDLEYKNPNFILGYIDV